MRFVLYTNYSLNRLARVLLGQRTPPWAPNQSEEDGMTIYTAYTLKHWYRGLATYLDVARQREQAGLTKSMFVCLEDLSDPMRERELHDAMIDFLFPGGHSYPYPRKVAASGAKPYSGGHGPIPSPAFTGGSSTP
jgi:hypothetical protein